MTRGLGGGIRLVVEQFVEGETGCLLGCICLGVVPSEEEGRLQSEADGMILFVGVSVVIELRDVSSSTCLPCTTPLPPPLPLPLPTATLSFRLVAEARVIVLLTTFADPATTPASRNWYLKIYCH